MNRRPRRSPARFLAPLALIIIVVAFLAIITSSGGGGSSTTDTGSQTTSASTSQKSSKSSSGSTTTAAKKKTGRRFYTVQTGDTLGAIADKTGIPLDQIQSLNPDVDPHAMTTGQKIRLK